MAAATAAKRKHRYAAVGATYGNAAYDLDRAAVYGEESPLTRQRPLVRPREEVRARPRVRTREAGKVSLFAVVGFLAVGIFCALAILGNVELMRLSSDVSGLKNDLAALQSEEKQLRTQYELAFDLSTVEENVTSNGSMVKPQEGQILYLDLSEPDSVVLFQEEAEPLQGVEGVLAGIREIFDNVVEYFR